jgi:hypothetical protein
MEWNGFNKSLARTTATKKSASTYLLGPMIDATPSHPDTVLTSMLYVKRSLEEMNMKHVYISVDMQLYIVASQIKWSSPTYFKNVVLYPGVMHTVMSVCGAIGKLMKGSGIETLITSSFSSLAKIMNGSSWVMSMRAFRMVVACLLEKFFSTGQKTWEELCILLIIQTPAFRPDVSPRPVSRGSCCNCLLLYYLRVATVHLV